jgi:hypothetical protein
MSFELLSSIEETQNSKLSTQNSDPPYPPANVTVKVRSASARRTFTLTR